MAVGMEVNPCGGMGDGFETVFKKGGTGNRRADAPAECYSAHE